MEEGLIAFVAVVAVAAWIAALCWTFVLGTDVGWPGFASFVLVLAIPIAVVVGMTSGGENAEQACLDSGRAWAITGRHQEWQYSAATKTSHPVTVNTYGCVEWTR